MTSSPTGQPYGSANQSGQPYGSVNQNDSQGTTGPTRQSSNTTPGGTQQPTTGSLDDLAKTAIEAAKKARAQAARLVDANRARIEGAVEKLALKAHETTGGKYAKEVATAKKWIGKGVDVVAGTPGVSATKLSAPLPPVAQPQTPTQAAPTAPGTGPFGTGTPNAGQPTAPQDPAQPPQTGWRRGPDGEWTRS